MSKEKLPTAEEILHKHFEPLDPFDNICILNAMSVHSATLQARIDELERFNKDAADKIFELKLELRNLKAEKELIEYKQGALDIEMMDNQSLREQNERLREAVEYAIEVVKYSRISTPVQESIIYRLNEALKGETK